MEGEDLFLHTLFESREVDPPTSQRAPDTVQDFYRLMRSEEERLRTFRDWTSVNVSAEQLARAGFFSLRNGDRVQCAFCRGVIHRWQPGDDPMDEHRRHYPRCNFLMGYDVGNVPVGPDPVPRAGQSRGRDVCGGFAVASPLLQRFGLRLHPSRLPTRSRDVEAVDESVVCKVCLEREVGIALLPCGHVTCTACFESLRRCHVCRRPVAATAVIYLS